MIIGVHSRRRRQSLADPCGSRGNDGADCSERDLLSAGVDSPRRHRCGKLCDCACELFQAGAGMWGGPALGPNDMLPIPERLTLLSYMFRMEMPCISARTCCSCGCLATTSKTQWELRFLLFSIVSGWSPDSYMPGRNRSRRCLWLVPVGRSLALSLHICCCIRTSKSGYWRCALFRFEFPGCGARAVDRGAGGMLFVRDQGPTAWWAHVGGIVAGGLLILVMRRPGVPLWGRTGFTPTASGPGATGAAAHAPAPSGRRSAADPPN